MREKKEAIAYCLTYPEVYEDYPFHDPNWCVIRHKKTKKVFAWIFDKDGAVWINVKCDPEWRDFWREAFASVLPAYHLNKKYWNSIILDGTIPEKEIQRMIGESYDLTRKKSGPGNGSAAAETSRKSTGTEKKNKNKNDRHDAAKKQDSQTDTIRYYDTCAESFVENTLHADVSEIRNRFLGHLAPGVEILDFGCGSGRDTKAFLERGYRVTAIDGSAELCRIASDYTGIPVRQMPFCEFKEHAQYDGIWACASILHLPRRELADLFRRLAEALTDDGVLYVSFKYGAFEGERGGRYFTDMTEESLRELLQEVPELWEEEAWETGDVRAGREGERWVNMLLGKRKPERPGM